jgi:hypothetical protein
METHPELLEQYKPFLKYDSQESYFADSAAEWTDNPGNELKRADGTVLATAEHGLDLAFLGTTYTPDAPAAATDVIGARSKDYREQARRLHDLPGYANHVYGHAVPDAAGDLWLQYWFFYFYNDYNLIGHLFGAGLHEGDWEMIQVRLRGGEPDVATFCQHKGASQREWRQVDVLPGTQRPIVYVARGSHASYFEPGTHPTGHWFDHADGKRRSPELTLNVVDESDPQWRWVRWPGFWGDTKEGHNPVDSGSPTGPAAHPQWDDPLSLLKQPQAIAAAVPAERAPSPMAPHVTAKWVDGQICLSYDATQGPGGKQPVGLAVTINSPDESESPTTHAFPIESAKGEVILPADADPSRTYDLYTSVAIKGGLASESVRSDLSPATRASV